MGRPDFGLVGEGKPSGPSPALLAMTAGADYLGRQAERAGRLSGGKRDHYRQAEIAAASVNEVNRARTR